MKDVPNIIDWEKRREERFYKDKATITNYLKSQFGESDIIDKVLKQLIEKNESKKFDV